MEEIWVVFAVNYMVSNFGNVDSLIGKRKRMTLRIDKYGYSVVDLWINGKRKTFKVHRLVAICFIPNPNEYTDVHHINKNRSDNRVENLQWCNRAEHIQKHSKLNPDDIIEMFRLYNVEGWSQQKIADHFWISRPQVSRILKRKQWNHLNIPIAYLKKENTSWQKNINLTENLEVIQI